MEKIGLELKPENFPISRDKMLSVGLLLDGEIMWEHGVHCGFSGIGERNPNACRSRGQ